MATPIKDTPTLRGKDAKKFLHYTAIENVKKVSPEELARIKLHYEMFKDAKPMVGEELDILNKTYKRLLSSTPTRFKRK